MTWKSQLGPVTPLPSHTGERDTHTLKIERPGETTAVTPVTLADPELGLQPGNVARIPAGREAPGGR